MALKKKHLKKVQQEFYLTNSKTRSFNLWRSHFSQLKELEARDNLFAHKKNRSMQFKVILELKNQVNTQKRKRSAKNKADKHYETRLK